MKKIYSTIAAICCVLGALMFTSSNLSAQPYTVAFSVDMNTYTGTQDYVALGVTMGGTFNGWCAACTYMTDADGDGIYTDTISGVGAGPFEWKFVVGDWVDDEIFAGGEECTFTTGANTNRYVVVESDMEICTQNWEACVTCPSMGNNDNLCDAMALAVGDTISADNTGATSEGIIELGCWFDDTVENDIWFTFEAPASGAVSVETIFTGENDDTSVAIWSSDSDCTGTLTIEACNDDISGSDFMSYVEAYGLNGGETYWLQVDGWQGTEGAFDLSVQELNNDAACDAFPLTVGETVSADNTGATPDGPVSVNPVDGSDCWFDNTVENDIWFTFEAPASGGVSVETINTGDNDDTSIAIFSSDSDCTGTLTVEACNDDISGSDFMSYVEVSGLTPGDTYWLQVDGWQGTEGAFDLLVDEFTPPICEGSTAIICDDFESYDLGPDDFLNAAHWALWPAAGVIASNIIDYRSFSGDKSMRVGVGPVEDPVLEFGTQESGVFTADWMMYVPSDSTAYFNGQAISPNAGGDWTFHVFMGTDGALSLTLQDGVTEYASGTFPQDQWFSVSHTVDLDNDLMSLSVDGVEITNDYPHDESLGGINFYANGDLNTYYLDDVVIDGEVLDPCPAPTAIICDNIDSYDVGSAIHGLAPYWAPWPPASDPSFVSDEQAFSNDKSLKVGVGNAEDNLLLLGNVTEGARALSWMMYIPTDNSGYFNIQDDEVPGTWNLDAFFNEANAAPGTGTIDQDAAAVITFPHDEWFQVAFNVDMDNDLLTMDVAGTPVLTAFAYPGNLGSINFYANGLDNTYYVDDVVYDEGVVGVTEYDQNVFSMFPNPTSDIITIQSEKLLGGITVTDMIGSVVLRPETNYASVVEVNLGALTTGMYLISIEVEGKIYTKRVLKK